MKVSLKFILATILLMLSYSIGGNAMDFASCVSKCESSCQLSESSSDIKSNSFLLLSAKTQKGINIPPEAL